MPCEPTDFGFTKLTSGWSAKDVESVVRGVESWSFHLPEGDLHFDEAHYGRQFLEAGSVDCIVTDPAYWTLDKWRSVGTTTRLGGARKAEDRDESRWFKTITADELLELIDEFSRLLKKNSHAWVMCDGETLGYVLKYARENYKVSHEFNYYKPFPVIKRAATGGYKQGMGYHGRCSHEYVVLLEKGRRRFNDENWPDVFEIEWNGGSESKAFTPDNKPYPTAKPVSLFRRWIELSTIPGETVYDPFLGSGTTAVAAVQSGRRFVGIDVSAAAVVTTARRIQDCIQPQQQLVVSFDE